MDRNRDTFLGGQLGVEVDEESKPDRLVPGKRTLSAQISAAPSRPGPAMPVVLRSSSGGAPRLGAGTAEQISRLSGSGGGRLPIAMLSRLGDSLGADLGEVRVHTDDDSATAADAVAANAFTVGKDIHFARGAYQPDTPAGQRLIAHEVAHTVQQAGGAAPTAAQADLRVSQPGDAFESEADAFADAFVGGATPAPVAPGRAGAMVSRDPVAGAPPAADTGRDAAYFNKAGVEAVRARASALMLSIALVEADANATLASVKHKVLGFAAAYRDGWREFERVLHEAHEAAEAQEAWKEAAEELALGILAAATAGVALEVVGVAEALEGASATVQIAAGAAKGMAEKGMADAAGAVIHAGGEGGGELEATGVTPDAMDMKSWEAVSKLATAMSKLGPAADSVSNLNSIAEYCIGEIKARIGNGTGGDLTEDEVFELMHDVVAAGTSLQQVQLKLDRAKIKLAGAKAVNDATPELDAEEVEKQIWTRWMARLPPDSNTLDLDPIENHLRALGLVSWVLVWYSDADEAHDVNSAKDRLGDMNREQRDLERAQRRAEREATEQANRDREDAAASDAAAADSDEDSSRPVGNRTHAPADFRKAEVEAARGSAATLAAAITIVDTRGAATQRSVADSFRTYQRGYRHAWTSFSNVLAAGSQSAREQEEWINRLSGYALAGMTGGAAHGIEHLAHAKHGAEHAAQTVGHWLATTAAEKGTEIGAHRAVHAHVDGSHMEATGVTPDSIDASIYHTMVDLCEALLGLSGTRLTVGMLLGATEYCLGEVKAWLAGGAADMTEDEVIDMAGAVISAAASLGSASDDAAAAGRDLDAIDRAATTAQDIDPDEIEKQIWTLWMASLPRDSDLLDIDPIQEHLVKLGLVTDTWYYTDEDERRDLFHARVNAAFVRGDRRDIRMPSASADEGEEGGEE